MAKTEVPAATSATTITTATTTTTATATAARLPLRLLLETRRFPAFALKVTNPQSLSPPPPPPLSSPLPQSAPTLSPQPCSAHRRHPPSSPPLHLHCLIPSSTALTRLAPNASSCLAFPSHPLGVDSKRKASATPKTPKLLSPPVSSSCARYTSPSEA